MRQTACKKGMRDHAVIAQDREDEQGFSQACYTCSAPGQ
jgi:hypothetical protein